MINAEEAKRLAMEVRANIIDEEVEELCNIISDCIDKEIAKGNLKVCLNEYWDMELFNEKAIGKAMDILEEAHYSVIIHPYKDIDETILFYYISWDIEIADDDDEEVKDDEPTEKEEDSDEF